MRIGVNCFLLQAHIGGLKQYFLTLFHELLEKDTDNEYIFFWFPHNADELAKLGTDRWKEKAILLQDQCEVKLHLAKIDLYFCPFGALYPCPLSIPTVVTLVDIQEMFYPEFFTLEDRYNRDLYYISSTHMADRVITISEFSKQTLIQHHHLPDHKVIVAYLSADERYYRSAEIEQPPAQQLPANFVFYPANFWKHKNHDRLLQSLRLLRDEQNLTIEIVFTGFEQSNGYPLREKVLEYGLASQVHMPGYVTVEQVAYLYRHARMLVFPSLFEGFGIPLVEAMAGGCPVVAAKVTSIPEVVGSAAELFDPASVSQIAKIIAKVWYDDTLRKEMIRKGQHQAQKFSVARTAQAHKLAFSQAARAYSYPRYLWNNWIYRYYHRARVELRWHVYRQTYLLQEWLSTRGGWFQKSNR
jgi:glycosyltransferase involved in cell wall biosynthesis